MWELCYSIGYVRRNLLFPHLPPQPPPAAAARVSPGATRPQQPGFLFDVTRRTNCGGCTSLLQETNYILHKTRYLQIKHKTKFISLQAAKVHSSAYYESYFAELH